MKVQNFKNDPPTFLEPKNKRRRKGKLHNSTNTRCRHERKKKYFLFRITKMTCQGARES